MTADSSKSTHAQSTDADSSSQFNVTDTDLLTRLNTRLAQLPNHIDASTLDQETPPGKAVSEFSNMAGILPASICAPLRGVLDPANTHMRPDGITPAHVALHLGRRIRDAADDRYGAGQAPVFAHVGWRQTTREAFEVAATDTNVQPCFRTVPYAFRKSTVENDDDLAEYNHSAQQKAWWIMRRNLVIPWMTDYTHLRIGQFYLIRFADTTDGDSHLHHFTGAADELPYDISSEFRDSTDNLSVTIIELTPDTDGEFINFLQVPGIGTDPDISVDSLTEPAGEQSVDDALANPTELSVSDNSPPPTDAQTESTTSVPDDFYSQTDTSE